MLTSEVRWKYRIAAVAETLFLAACLTAVTSIGAVYVLSGTLTLRDRASGKTLVVHQGQKAEY